MANYQKRTRILYLTLLEAGCDERTPFVASTDLADRVGVSLKNLRNIIADLVADGVVRREPLPWGEARLRGARTRYYLTGVPYEMTGESRRGVTPMHLEPRIVRKIGPLDRWRSLTGMLLGDPPIGRSALDMPRAARRSITLAGVA